MAHVEPIKTNGRAYNVSPAVFLAMPGFRQMHITFTLQTIWMAKCGGVDILNGKTYYNGLIFIPLLYTIIDMLKKMFFLCLFRCDSVWS